MGTSVSFVLARKIAACLIAALLSLALVPASALAEGEGSGADNAGTVASGLPDQVNDSTDSSSGEPQEVSAEQDTEDSPVAPMLASGLVGKPSSFINSDVILDSEPIVGSFTVDGLTYAVIDESRVELVGVAAQATASEDNAAGVASGLPDQSNDSANLVLLETISYAGVDYVLVSIAAYAFYLSDVASVTLPSSINDVDDRAFRSSDVANVTVAEGNPSYSSFDGVLYDASQSSLLLIPEGKQGAVILPKEAETVPPSSFSHCSLVDTVSVEDGSAAFASENGLLYSSDLTTLLRVPAGAEEITIREGCTAIAAGALEACAKLTTINAPATVTSISPDIFHAIPTVSLPAASAILSEGTEGPEVEESNKDQGSEGSTQLTAMVALSSTDDDLPEAEPSHIMVRLPHGIDSTPWEKLGFHIVGGSAEATLGSAATYAAGYQVILDDNGATSPGQGVVYTDGRANGDGWYSDSSLRNKIKYVRCPARTGYLFDGYYGFSDMEKKELRYINSDGLLSAGDGHVQSNKTLTAQWYYVVAFDVQGGATLDPSYTKAILGTEVELPVPVRENYSFQGWDTMPDGSGTRYQGSALDIPTGADARVVLYAQWRLNDQDVSFDTSFEPGDEDYPGEEKPDQTITGEQIEAGEKVEISNPSRPGYVFQGWAIPNADGEHALDQDLIYSEGEGDDKKWYVDASKLPDYYEQLKNEEGKIELTARWTSVISVDVPSSATFYYDLVTDQSAEAHEAALSGTTSFSSKSRVDLRICGLESKKAAGADALFSSGADSALLSVYPAPNDKAQTVEGAQQGPAGAKPATAVDFSLDDIVLERAFTKEDADAYKIPAGDDLTLAYRLNLGGSAKLDYDKILAIAEGDEAALTAIAYTFAPVHGHLNPDGRVEDGIPADEPLYLTQDGYWWGLDKIKDAANCIAETNAASPCAAFYSSILLDTAKRYANAWGAAASPFMLKTGSSYVEAQLIGVHQDTLYTARTTEDGQRVTKAGLTFQTKELIGQRPMNASGALTGWQASELRAYLRGGFRDSLGAQMRSSDTGIVDVWKAHQLRGTMTLQTTSENVFVPSIYEALGLTVSTGNRGETASNSFYYQAFSAGSPPYRELGGKPAYAWCRSVGYSSGLWSHVGTGGGYNQSASNTTAFGGYLYGAAPCFAL